MLKNPETARRTFGKLSIWRLYNVEQIVGSAEKKSFGFCRRRPRFPANPVIPSRFSRNCGKLPAGRKRAAEKLSDPAIKNCVSSGRRHLGQATRSCYNCNINVREIIVIFFNIICFSVILLFMQLEYLFQCK